MKSRTHLLPALLLMGGGLALADTVPAQIPPSKEPRGLRPTIGIPVRECRDPAAESLAFQVLSRDRRDATHGRIRITGVVRNIGNAEFVSDPRQAKAQLLETAAGVGVGTVRAERALANLAAGSQFSLTYDRDWSTSLEFPPKYTLLIVYDPDIRSDDNRKNDDCNSNNNRRELTGEQINRGWR